MAEAGRWAADRFDEFDRQYFPVQMPNGVCWGLTPQNTLSFTDVTGRIALCPALRDYEDPMWRRGQPYLGESFAPRGAPA